MSGNSGYISLLEYNTEKYMSVISEHKQSHLWTKIRKFYQIKMNPGLTERSSDQIVFCLVSLENDKWTRQSTNGFWYVSSQYYIMQFKQLCSQIVDPLNLCYDCSPLSTTKQYLWKIVSWIFQLNSFSWWRSHKGRHKTYLDLICQL